MTPRHSQDLITAGPPPGGVDVDAVAGAVRALPSVAGLHPGRYGEVATYLPGRRVAGVRVTEQAVWVHVVARLPTSAAETGAAVQRAIAGYTAGLPVEVAIADLALPDEDALIGREDNKES